MTWLKLSDDFTDRPAVWRLSHGAFRLHVSGLNYANRMLLEGVVPGPRVPALIPHYRPAYLDELLAGGTWTREGDDFRILDSADDQLTRADVLALREKRAAAGRMGGLVSGKKRRRGANGAATPEALASALAPHLDEANGNPGPVPGLRGQRSHVQHSVPPKKRRAAVKASLSVEELEALTHRVPATSVRTVLSELGADNLADLSAEQRLEAVVRLGLGHWTPLPG